MILYQKRRLSDMADIGELGPLPDDLLGLEQASLNDLHWTWAPLGYTPYGFFPVEVADPEPEPTVPMTVTQLQFRRELRARGLLAGILQYIDGLPEPQRTLTDEAFQFASEFRRDSNMLNTAAQALFGFQGQALLDDVFIEAKKIIE